MRSPPARIDALPQFSRDGPNSAIVRSTISASTTNVIILLKDIRMVMIQCGGSPATGPPNETRQAGSFSSEIVPEGLPAPISSRRRR
jgi:hypothetical protein